MPIKISEPHQVGLRLDLSLPLNFPQYSRSNIRKMLDQGMVQVNGQVEYRPNYRVQLGDELYIQEDKELERKILPATAMKLSIVYEDEDIIVVDKPSGLKVHPISATDHDSLLNGLYYQLGESVSVSGLNLVNRIDKGTSGIVVVAKSARGSWHYAQQFAQSTVQKQYLAVVSQRWNSKFGHERVKAADYLRYDSNMKRQFITKQGLGEYALTYFQLLGSGKKRKASLLLAEPQTGRTHQIRVQLSQLGFPIWGDEKYDGPEFRRLMLHAYKLTMTKPDGEKLELETPIPPEFDELIIDEQAKE